MFNDGARIPIVRAQQAVSAEGSGTVGTWHLLAAILGTDCDAAAVLHGAGLRLEEPEAPAGPSGGAPLQLSDGFRAAVAGARIDATMRRHPYITSCHLAAALLRHAAGDPAVASAFAASPTTPEDCRERLLRHVDAHLAA